MKKEKQISKKSYNLINNIIKFYTKVFVTLFGDEINFRHNKDKINVRNTSDLSEHMKRDLGLD
ncbi:MULTISPECIES: hypothetical protein [Vibrio]|uniref:hypothetical protein n=1 Tax=Vibrio TaxID=662 RepID=UPI0010506A25|nr:MULTISPECIES: hypothetical protein [Vibrio]MCG9639832.1 hypothetical protein [Vibrio sp. Isolate34]TCO01313.1 hypothetical protein EDB51_10759 [Vibrio crassostreae]CAK2101457.1 conserved hypothetical protein [Vibrio crassostreae]CAK2101755.1 conserved hypothetical protein [Vibrio crassostreae]CAK2109839.1 conserved hypothetical protein [Vibrio crassostreae]